MYGQRPHLCGCIPCGGNFANWSPQYLPQLSVEAHSTILSTTSRTTLTQTFANPTAHPIKEAKYVFPLYDGVSVVAFKCTIGDRVIEGVVKERAEARKEYEAAKTAGLTTGLMEQSYDAADIFTTMLGNIPALATFRVDIQFVGVLKQDFQTEGIRFTLPTELYPRYGDSELSSSEAMVSSVTGKGFSATVDIQLPDGVAIKAVQSPSHPIDVSIGTTSANADAEPSLSAACAAMAQANAPLDTDFVVIITPSKTGEPVALLETHATMPNQRALMTSLTPKFVLPAEAPEIVFVCDRSGSMGSNIGDLKRALNVFIKSLPAGVSFNICSFGSHFDFLWPHSRLYDESSVSTAIQHIETFDANYGGTEMYRPIEAVFKQRHEHSNLEVFVLTDGEIWGQEKLFDLINKESLKAGGNTRLFSLGIGSGASTSLVEGMARTGNGFAQFVADGEKMDKKVVRMLKASLYPHIANFKLELEYEGGNNDSDDFEVIDSQSTIVESAPEEAPTANTGKVLSLFDTTAKVDDAPPPPVPPLPDFGPQPYVQTPSTIPPLFPFHRSTVFVFLNDTGPQKKVKSVVLSADSKHGQLRLAIPVSDVGRGTTIHQLAARKESHELEEGRGWIASAKDSGGKAGRERFKVQWDAVVKREAVAYGLRYQVANRWCSFIAVEKRPDGSVIPHDVAEREVVQVVEAAPMQCLSRGTPMMSRSLFGASAPGAPALRSAPPRARKLAPASGGLGFGAPAPAPAAPAPSGGTGFGGFGQASGGGLFEAADSAPAPSGGHFGSAPSAPPAVGGAFGDGGNGAAFEAAAPAQPTAAGLFGDASPAPARSGGLFGASAPQKKSAPPIGGSGGFGASPAAGTAADPALEQLTVLQRFDGSWVWSAELERILGLSAADAHAQEPAAPADVLATALAVAYFRTKLADEADVWELMVQKAEAWLASRVGGATPTVDWAKAFFK